MDTEFGRTITFIAGFIACLSGIFTSLISESSLFASSLIVTCFPWLSFVFSYFVHGIDAEEMPDQVLAVTEDRCITDPQLKVSFTKFKLQMFFYSVVFSFVLFVNLTQGFGGDMTLWIWIGVFAAALLIMIYVTWLNQYLRIDMLQWVLLIAVSIVLPLTYVSTFLHSLAPLCCAIMMFSFTAYDLLSLSQLNSLISINKVSFLRYFVSGRFSNASGVFIGWTLSAISMYMAQVSGNILTAQIIPIVLLAVFVVFIASSSFDNYWAGIRTANIEAKKEATGSWKKACDAISSECGLSAREHEVFILCAKGRDSVFISDALYISVHTVKSHIYHVYQKLDVHSQQELISMVEERAANEKGI